MCFFLGKCSICWIQLALFFKKCASFWGNVQYVQYVQFPRGKIGPPPQSFPRNWNILNILNISPERSTFLKYVSQKIEHIQHFPRKERFFGRLVSINEKTLNHFPRKKHILTKRSGKPQKELKSNSKGIVWSDLSQANIRISSVSLSKELRLKNFFDPKKGRQKCARFWRIFVRPFLL